MEKDNGQKKKDRGRSYKETETPNYSAVIEEVSDKLIGDDLEIAEVKNEKDREENPADNENNY